ncbi:MAG: hypothetical protein AB7G05_15405 [Hyphomonadaceae bacterium]
MQDNEAAIDRVPQESPGLARRFWSASNEQSSAFTGNLTASIENETLILAFARGVTVRARRIGACDGAVSTGVDTLAGTLGAPEDVRIQIYDVAEERLSESAQSGGLCGPLPTQTIAAAEFVGEEGEWVLRLASFQERFTANAAPDDPKACFFFDYVPPS